jgi:alcohol dehydrogenase
VYDKVTPDPTVPQIIAGADLFNAEKCDGIIAFGGGSSIDCAKVVGARAVKKGRSIESFAGTLQVEPSALVFGSSLPPLIAVPTTAGTGSEATFGAIVRDAEKVTIAFVG